MDDGDNVHEENLVDDQMAQAINDSASTAVSDDGDDTAVAVADEPSVDDQLIPTPVTSQPTVQPSSEPTLAETEAAVAAQKTSSAPTSADDEELIGIKKNALEQLSPLVSHLDLPPEQRFDTLMEIIRASDDKSLVKPAYEAAQQIEDDDKKAQALLDVVNEVNYLTHHDE